MTDKRLLFAFLAIATLGVSPSRGEAQDSSAGGRPVHRGFALELLLVGTKPWTTTEYTEFGISVSTIEEAGGLGLNLSYAVHPRLALFASADLSFYGNELSGYTLVLGGAEYRWSLSERFEATLGGGLGRYVESSNIRFTVGALHGGIEFFLFRRLSIGAGVQVVDAIGDGKRLPGVIPHDGTPTTRVTLDGTIRRRWYGVSWYPGRSVR